MTSSEQSSTSSLDEYKSVCENMRHYANMRFAQLTLFFGLNAAFVSAVFVTVTPTSAQFSRTFSVGALFASCIFLLLEERAADYWHYLRRRAITLEESLGFSQWRDRPERVFLSATNGVRALFAMAILFWLLSACGRGVL